MPFLHNVAKIDWVLMGCLFALATMGLVVLAPYQPSLFEKQLVWYAIGFTIVLLGSQLDWQWLLKWPIFTYGFYGVSILLLILSNAQSRLVRGTKGWLSIGSLQIEPVEFAKLGLIFLLASFFTSRYVAAWRTKYLFSSLGITLIPTLLAAVHPDVGSAVILFSIWIGFMLVGGINKKRFMVGILIFCVIAIFIWSFFLKDYQRERLVAFLSPEKDPLGINYNVIQAKVAIGSAGFWGKGYGQGTQTELHFLPEAHTDFIFAAFLEEWGIFGGILMILTYLLLFSRLVNIGLMARSNSFKFLVFGVTIVFFTQIVINIGSNLGLVPVTGITLPFVSYGGSSVLTLSVLLSIIQHIRVKSH